MHSVRIASGLSIGHRADKYASEASRLVHRVWKENADDSKPVRLEQFCLGGM
jgi:hypothetical protein